MAENKLNNEDSRWKEDGLIYEELMQSGRSKIHNLSLNLNFRI